ncbi:MAG: regulatory protein RecX [Pseudomonadota bacterium]
MRAQADSLSDADAITLRRRAMDLLARREHAREVLYRKLVARGASPEDVAAVLEALERDGLLSETRFVEAFVRQQLSRGKGPVAIEHGLRERGIGASDAALAVEALEVDWVVEARAARVRRFGAELPVGEAARAKQARFLQSRGFSGSQTLQALECNGAVDSRPVGRTR